MRTFFATHWKSIVALVVLVLLAVFVVPGGSASPTLAMRLQARAEAVAQHAAGPKGLDGAANYIASTLATQGYQVRLQRDIAGGHVMQKIEAWHSVHHTGRQPLRSFILAARYGSLDDDELAATAAMLELARMLKSVHPADGTEIRFVFFVTRALPLDGSYGSFVAYAGPRGALGRVGQALAFFRRPPEGAAGALAAPAWVQGVTLGHLKGSDGGDDGGMLLADIGSLHSPCIPAADGGQPDYKTVARMVGQLALSMRSLAGITEG